MKSLVPGEGVQLSSTSDLVTISTTPNLIVSSLTPSDASPIEVSGSAQVSGGLTVAGLSQFAGVEASGLVADQVVWVTGDGAPAQSIMFPGSLQLGKWRIRGSEAGEFYLERFDDDGELQTDAWYPVCTWGFNTQINSPGMGIDNLGVVYNLSAGNITAGSLTVEGTDVLSALGGKQDQLSNEGFGTELLYESTKLKRLQFGAGIVGGTDLQQDGTQNISISVSPNLSVESLTVGGTNVANALDARELAFTAVAPLRKVVNLQTGALELRVDELGSGGNPIFCGGRVDGATASPLSSVGRVGYTVSRPSGQGTGVWTVTFDSPAPNNDYVVNLSVMLFGSCYMWDALPPTVNGFTAVVVNNFWQLRNAPFHFTILA